MASSYELDYAKKMLQYLSSDDFVEVEKFYSQLKSTEKRAEYIKKLQEWRLDKYKTVEEVRKYIFSLKDKIEKQATVIDWLNNRNSMLAEFIVKNAINDKISAKDMIELSDWYSERFGKLMEVVWIQEEKTKEKYNHEVIESTIKALKEPDYWYEYWDWEPF